MQKQREKTREKNKQKSRKKETTECPECKSTNLIQDDKHAELICNNCKLVIQQQQIDPGPEWRVFDEKDREKKSRIGPPNTKRMHDQGLTTTIDYKNIDSHGNTISNKRKKQVNRLRKWQNRIRTKDSKERNLKFALGEIERMSSSLDIPESTREIASTIYRKALDEELLPGRSIEAVATSSLRAACRQDNIPRSLDEIVDVSRVDKQEIARTYRYIKRELGLKIGLTDPSDFVPRFASELNLSEEVQQKAKEIIKKSANKGLLSGKSPKGYAAAAIYLASILCNEKRTQKEVAKAADVTEVTIRNRYQEQEKILDVEYY